MTFVHDEAALTAQEQAPARSGPPSRPSAPRRWPWLVAALVAVALVISGGVWWLIDSTVPTADYDDLVAELDATEEALAGAQDALAMEQSAATELRARVHDLEVRIDRADEPALLLAYFAGLEKPDTVRGQLWDRTWGGVVSRDSAVERIGDPSLTELYWEHLDGGMGEPVPGVADSELIVRLIELILEAS